MAKPTWKASLIMDCRMKCTSYVAMPYPMATIRP